MRKKASETRLASEAYHQRKTAFNKELFLPKLLRWIIHNDLPFNVVNSIHFRAIMLEASSILEDYGCLQTDETIKCTIIEDYQGYKGEVTERLRTGASKIHTSFDPWTSRTHIALCGIVMHFVDANYQMQNFLLSIPEIEGKHSGLNIAETALAIQEAKMDVEQLKLWRSRRPIGSCTTLLISLWLQLSVGSGSSTFSFKRMSSALALLPSKELATRRAGCLRRTMEVAVTRHARWFAV